MLRLFDFLFSLFGLILGGPVLLMIYLIGLFDTGSPIFRQERVGRDQKPAAGDAFGEPAGWPRVRPRGGLGR